MRKHTIERVAAGGAAALIAALAAAVYLLWPTLKGEWLRHNIPIPAGAAKSTMAYRTPYARDSFWNTPIDPDPVYDPHSAPMIETLAQTQTGGAFLSDTTRFSYPVYWADDSTPRYQVECTEFRCAIMSEDDIEQVTDNMTIPIPDGAQPSSGTDAQLIVIDTVTGAEYGLFHASFEDGAWTAGAGYRYSIYADGTPLRMRSRGAGMPYYAGLIRPWEVRQGAIRHVIAFAYEHAAAERCVYPATKTDGTSTLEYAIPQGAHLQLNPALTDADFAAMGLSYTGKIVARALQQYGMVLVDTGGSNKIMAEDLHANPTPPDAWDDLGYDRDVIRGIPYTEFRVLALPDGYRQGGEPDWGRCIR